MGFRYRKSVKIAPGVKLNISKSGISTSIGKPGSTVNFSSRGTRVTTGIPGTGLSYSQTISKKRGRRPATSTKSIAQLKQEVKEATNFNHAEMRCFVRMAKKHPEKLLGKSDEEVVAIIKRHMKIRRNIIIGIFIFVIIGKLVGR